MLLGGFIGFPQFFSIACVKCRKSACFANFRSDRHTNNSESTTVALTGLRAVVGSLRSLSWVRSIETLRGGIIRWLERRHLCCNFHAKVCSLNNYCQK